MKTYEGYYICQKADDVEIMTIAPTKELSIERCEKLFIKKDWKQLKKQGWVCVTVDVTLIFKTT